MPDTDIAAAARRVAADIRMASHADALSLLVPDLRTLLPVLDALGAEPGEDRVERWADAMFADPERDEASAARIAIALADAEKAVEPPAG